jgi:4-amino-4-deoxy-L-arabinose transferase-like glycosyltransferase
VGVAAPDRSSGSARQRNAILALIVLVTAVRAVVATRAPLIDDEAYYWLWAHHLDWSYLDHPPLIAYLIALTTRVGDSELWVRASPLLLGAATTYVLYLFGRELFDHRAGIVAACVFQVVPVLAGGALLATPDAPLFLCWTAASRFAWQAIHGRPSRWTWTGAAVGVGLLAKLSMVLLPPGLLAFLLWRLRRGDALHGRDLFRAAAVALVLFLPVLYWNAVHDWAAFRFILHERPGGTPRGLAGIVEVMVQQLAFALLVFPVFLWAIWQAWRHRQDERYAYVVATALPVFLFVLAAAWTRGAPHGNWMGPGYLSLLVVLGAGWNRTVGGLAAISAALIIYGFLAQFVNTLPLLPGAEELYGWKEAAPRVQQEAAALGAGTILVADRYQIASQLSYHTRAALPATLLPCPNPASIWPHPGQYTGADAVAVLDARWSPTVEWSRHFRRVDEVEPLTVQIHGKPLRRFRVFRLHAMLPPEDCPPP